MKKSDLRINKFDKEAFLKSLNLKFNELVEERDPSFFDIDLATKEDFFELYEKFFYEISKYGGNNSHEYLIETSTNYIDYEKDNEEINLLLEEISQLRIENLKLQQKIIRLQSGASFKEMQDDIKEDREEDKNINEEVEEEKIQLPQDDPTQHDDFFDPVRDEPGEESKPLKT